MTKSAKRNIWKKAIIIVISAFGVLLLSIVGLAYFKKDDLISKALDDFNAGVEGRLLIGKTSISAFENFPYVSIDLQDIEIYETKEANTDAIIHIEDAYIGFDLWSIIQGTYEVKKIKLSDGFIKLIQYENGDINASRALAAIEQATATDDTVASPLHLDLQAIELVNIDLLKINKANNLLAEAFIEQVQSSFSLVNDQVKASLDTRLLFNLVLDGDTSFLHHKHVSFNTAIAYDLNDQQLAINPSELLIEKASFLMEGSIDVKNDLNLDLKFSGQKPNFDLFLAFVPEEFSPLLNRYDNGGTVYFDASVKGKAAFGKAPHVEIDFGCAEAFIENTAVDKGVNDLFFKGHFTTGAKNDASTMALTIEDFTAKPETGTFRGAVSIKNFESPDIQMQVNSVFDLDFLADFLDIRNLEDASGKVSLDMNFHDIIDLDDPSKTIERLNESYYTELIVENLGFSSPAFPLPLRDINIHASMEGHRAVVDQFTIKTGNSDISITADISDLPAVIHHTSLPVDVNLDVKADMIDIFELTGGNDSTSFDEQIKNLSMAFRFNSSARAFTESPNLPLGEFFISKLSAQLTHYPHKLHDFNADVVIDSTDLKVIDFTGMLDQSDFHFNGKLQHYDLWFKELPQGSTTIDFNLNASLIQLNDLFSYGGANYVPEDYREEEFKDLKIHGISTLKFDKKLVSTELKIDKIAAYMEEHDVRFERFAGNLRMDSTHLEVTDFGGQVGNSSFTAQMNYYFGKDSTRLPHSFRLKSPHLDFDQLFSYVPPQPDSESGKVDHESGFNVFELPFDNLSFDIAIDKMNYHRYLLDDFTLQGRMQKNHYLYVDTMSVNTAGGQMRLNGYFNGSDPEAIYFSPNMQVENIDLDKLLFKFDNFGQDQLVSDNLHGQLTGTLTGAIHMHPDLIPVIDDSALEMDIEVLNGSLVDFSAFSAMSDYFTDKNLSLVRFDTLKNNLSLKNGELIIPKMNINTSLGYFEISGRQGLNLQMEYDVRIPLKVVAKAGVQKLFGRKNRDNSDQVDEIQYRDQDKRTRFININIKGTPEDYDISLGKKERGGQRHPARGVRPFPGFSNNLLALVWQPKSSMKKVLITLLLVFSIQTAFSQSYRYWMSYEVQAFSNVVKNQRVQFYKKKVNNRSYIKMVNNSCFDVRYSFKIVHPASRNGKDLYPIEKKGIIKKGTSLYFEKYVPKTSYIGFRDYGSDYNEYGDTPKVTYFYPAQEDNVWTRDIVVLNCLGFDSAADYQSKKKATTARLAEEAMERFREEMKQKKIADERKLRQYLDKGFEHHIQHYESKKKDGFYYNVPMDSLEMIANYYGKYMIIVHTGPGYRPGMFELGEEEETFLDNQIVTGLSHVRDRSFFPWAEKKKVKLSYTPAVIIMDPTGRVIHSQSLNTTQLKTGFATWVKGIAQSLPVSEN